MNQVFRHRRIVRFGECDPAGVVYYPVFFNWFHEAMEAWFEEALAVPYADVLKQFGFPAAQTEASFQRPFRLGDAVSIELRIKRLGQSSFTLQFCCKSHELVCATGSVTCVCIRHSGQNGFDFASAPLPEHLREAMSAYEMTHEEVR